MMTKFEGFLLGGAVVLLLTILFVLKLSADERKAKPTVPPAPPCTGATIAGRECVVCTRYTGDVTAIDCR